jgi:hypothetical protein
VDTRRAAERLTKGNYMVNKQGMILANSRCLYYYVTHKEAGQRVAKFGTVEQCQEEIKLMTNTENWKVDCDWVIVKG